MIVAFSLWEVRVLRVEAIFTIGCTWPGLVQRYLCSEFSCTSGVSGKRTQAPRVDHSKCVGFSISQPAFQDLSAFPLVQIWGHLQVYSWAVYLGTMWDPEAQVTSTWNPHCRVPPCEGLRVSPVTEKVKSPGATLSCLGVALAACDISGSGHRGWWHWPRQKVKHAVALWNPVWLDHTFAICLVHLPGHEKLLL